MEKAKPDYPVAVSSTLHTREARWSRSGRHDCREYGPNFREDTRCPGGKSKGAATAEHGMQARSTSWAFELEMIRRAATIARAREQRAWAREKRALGLVD